MMFYYLIYRDYGLLGISIDVIQYLIHTQQILPLARHSLVYVFPPVFLAYLIFALRKERATHTYYYSLIAFAEFASLIVMLDMTQKFSSEIIKTGANAAESTQQFDMGVPVSLDDLEEISENLNALLTNEIPPADSNNEEKEEDPIIVKAMPEDNTFFGKNYVAAVPEIITPPEKKKNIILIFMESMEMTFSDSSLCGANLIPFLQETAQKNVSFSNFTDGYATNWTQASLVAATTGLPSSYLHNIKEKGQDVNDAGKDMKQWLSGVYSLGEILRDNGYERLFVQGGSLEFSGTGNFLKSHGFKGRSFGSEELKSYEVSENAWGIEDKDIYGIFEDKLSHLPKDKPFFAVLTTIDTHHYNEPEYAPKMFDMRSKDTIYYADSLIKDFLNYFYLQPYAKDTVLIITGDHLRMSGGPKSGSAFLNAVPHEKRRIYNAFINAPKIKNTDRKMSQIDMFPTILEAAGFDIKGHKLGLGVSVFSDEKTLAEQYGKPDLNRRLRKNSPLYGALWQ